MIWCWTNLVTRQSVVRLYFWFFALMIFSDVFAISEQFGKKWRERHPLDPERSDHIANNSINHLQVASTLHMQKLNTA